MTEEAAVKEEMEFPISTRVYLKSLVVAVHLNGLPGTVATELLEDGRVGVDLDEAWKDPRRDKMVLHRLKIKPRHLGIPSKAAPSIYHCAQCFEEIEPSTGFQCSRCKML
jgi:hypothetical protein